MNRQRTENPSASRFQVIGAKRWAGGVTAALWAVTLALGYVSDLPIDVAERDPSYQPWHEFPRIFASNLMVGLLLYSGVATFGVLTVAVSLLAGLYMGAVIGLGVNSFGFADAADLFFPFLIVELAGFMVLAFAGLLPITKMSIALRGGTRTEAESARGRLRSLTYFIGATLSTTLPYLLLGVITITIGAGLEIAGGLPR